MKLHPIDDGLIRMSDERTLTLRDKGGNKLVDIVDAKTGYCTGVRSNLTVPEGMSVLKCTPTSGTKSASNPDVRFDAKEGVYYDVRDMIRTDASDPVGLVMRTTEDPDGPLRKVRIIIAPKSKTGEPERNSTAPVRPAPSTRAENDAAVKAVLAAMKYEGPITPQIRKAVLEMIAIEKNTQCTLDRKTGKKSDSSNKSKKRSTRKPPSNSTIAEIAKITSASK